MILALHIIIALSSIVYSTYLYFDPAPKRFTIAYLLIGLTIASGMFMVVDFGAHLLRACIAGLFYLVAITTLLAFARRKLAKDSSR